MPAAALAKFPIGSTFQLMQGRSGIGTVGFFAARRVPDRCIFSPWTEGSSASTGRRADWVAELECGHNQHVRHNPPWTNRPWVVTPEGRARVLGQTWHVASATRRRAPSWRPESGRHCQRGKSFMSLVRLIDIYCKAWSEHDEGRRAELLHSVWAPEASYTDPTVHVVGASGLLAHIAKVQARRPGSKVVRTSEVDAHHGVARFAWRAIEAGGNALPEGIDLAFVTDDDSRIERIIGFFGPTRPRSE